MQFDSTIVDDLLKYAGRRFGKPCRIQFTAGWGCTVFEVFFSGDGDDLDRIPLERLVI